jgi:tetratricopeptide (TPR) repeat protein
VRKEKVLALVISLLCLFQYSSASACPDLSSFYEMSDDEIYSIEAELSELSDECSDSSEYFALLGSVQLKRGELLQANESLELSLLLNPQNGSALFDYAEILNQQGQVLNAIELGEELLTREDLPPGLEELIEERLRVWEQAATDKSFAIGLSVGYDDNLNSAPINDSLTLTLSGTPVVLDVAPEFQATGGNYSRFAINRFSRTTTSDTVYSLSGGVSGKFSDLSEHQTVQGSTRFILADGGDFPRWNIEAGLDYLNYGENSIFGSSTLRASYVAKRVGSCEIRPTAALQYQHFYKSRVLSGVEGSAGLGTFCQIPGSAVDERFGIEVGALYNKARDENRLGRDRKGWRVNMAWQKNLGRGTASVQYVHSELDDERGYSVLFDNGTRRTESLDSLNFRYFYPLGSLLGNANLVAWLSHYRQRSSVPLFRTSGTVAEISINWAF